MHKTGEGNQNLLRFFELFNNLQVFNKTDFEKIKNMYTHTLIHNSCYKNSKKKDEKKIRNETTRNTHEIAIC